MDALKRKLGPLQLWQWVLIGAVLGGGVLLWRRGHPAAAAAAGAVPSDAEYNPIDPTTGLPYAGGTTTSPSPDETPPPPPASLADLLAGFEQLEGLLVGLQDLQPGPAVETDQGAVQEQTGTGPARKKPGPLARAKAAVVSGRVGPVNRQRLRAAGYTDAQINYHAKHHTPLGSPKGAGHNRRPERHQRPSRSSPGHHETRGAGGKHQRSSSAPHNPRQHQHVQPPAHERHEPIKHPSAQHPSSPPPSHPAPPAHHKKKKKH